MDRRIASDSVTATRPPPLDLPTPPISDAGGDMQGNVDEHGFVGGFKMEVDEWGANPPYPPGYGTMPRGKPKAVSAQRSGVSEFGTVRGKQPYSTAPRQTQARPKAPVTQSMPGRTGRRPRAGPEAADGQDFGVSLERMRVSPTYS